MIRISGEEALAVADRVFRAASGRPLSEKQGYTAAYGGVYDGKGKLDESVATVFRAPHSYTGEDVVELSCHGGIVVTREVLRAVLDNGAVLAEAGEFTKRAFLNGKMNLTQAEAVADIITAKSRQALDAAKAQRDNALFRKIGAVKELLLNAAGHLSAWADYPEEDIPGVGIEGLSALLGQTVGELRRLLASFDTGMVLKEGIDTVIAGRPNVGKSTLMNLFAGADRSIVTDIAGTTRDVVEETVNLNGLLLQLSDTAGLRETSDTVEQKGVERARERLSTAALVLAVFDSSEELSEDDRRLTEELKGRPAVAVVNKTDLPPRLDRPYLEKRFGRVVAVSVKDSACLPLLERAIRETVHLLDIDASAPMLATERQKECAGRACAAAGDALDALEAGMTMDAVTISIEEALDALLELTGERATEEVVNNVFSHFCVGK